MQTSVLGWSLCGGTFVGKSGWVGDFRDTVGGKLVNTVCDRGTISAY